MKRDVQKGFLSLVAAVFVDVMLPHAQTAFEDAYRGMERANWRASTVEAACGRAGFVCPASVIGTDPVS